MCSHWTQHKDVIQRLYVEQRKTLVEVKKIMENDFEFPKTIPISSYEVAIRDELGLLKKLKKEHWPLLYQLFLRRENKPFDLYLDEALLYRWPKVWKELRRSRKTDIVPGVQLPPNLVLRTPISTKPCPRASFAATSMQLGSLKPREITSLPSMSSPASTSRTSRLATCKTKEHRLQFPIASLPSNMALTNSSTTSISETAGVEVQAHLHDGPFTVDVKLKLEKLPWNELRLAFLASLIGPEQAYSRQVIQNVSYAVIPKDKFSSHLSGQWLARVSDSVFPSIWDLGDSKASFMALTPNLNGYHFLNTLVYLLSNDLIDVRRVAEAKTFNGILDFLLHYIPKRIAYQFFNNDFLSVRAVWSGLLQNSYYVRRTDVFELLADIALKNHVDWISGVEGTMLEFAALSGNAGSIQKLLELESRIEIPVGPFSKLSTVRAIINATEAGFLECVRTLAGNFDLNELYKSANSPKVSIFQFFLGHMPGIRVGGKSESEALAETLKSYALTLDILLEAGADPDLPFIPTPRSSTGAGIHELHGKLQTHAHQLPTQIDVTYYWSQRLFFHLSLHSKKFKDRRLITRAGICRAAVGGYCGIADYLEGRSPDDTSERKEFLELIFLEQFFVDHKIYIDHRSYKPPRCKVNAGVARALLDYGVKISQDFRNSHGGANTLLERLMTSLHHTNWTEDERFLLQYLILDISTISAWTVGWAVQAEGTRLLDLLALHGHDVSQYGALALVVAVQKKNSNAIEWLLENGVNIKGEVPSAGGPLTVLGAAIGGRAELGGWGEERSELAPSFRLLSRTVNHSMALDLIQAGAELKLKSTDQNPFRLLEQAAGWDSMEEMYSAFQCFTSFHTEMAKIRTEEWISILIKMMTCGSHVRWDHTGCCLRCQLFEVLLEKHCESTDCEKLLAAVIYAGAMEDLVQNLLARTANIDDHSWDLTPLQAAAGRCNKHLVSQLLSLGADVNAPAGAGVYGFTALQAICRWKPVNGEETQRKSEMIEFLLANGARANDEADTGVDIYTALQFCVANGDLKHVALLLEHGADPNTPCCWMGALPHWRLYSTLGLSVRWGRLDIAHLLVNMGALSSRPGQTGYDGALRYARLIKQTTIAKMIQRHADEQEALFRQHPGMRSQYEASVQQHKLRMEQHKIQKEKILGKICYYEGD